MEWEGLETSKGAHQKKSPRESLSLEHRIKTFALKACMLLLSLNTVSFRDVTNALLFLTHKGPNQ